MSLSDPTSPTETSTTKISLPIHQIIHSLQVSHGNGLASSHQDHSGYVKYLSNKLHKTRKNLNFLYVPASSSANPNPKSSSAAAAASFEYHEITLEMCQQNPKYFHLLIYSLEKYFIKSLIAKNSFLTISSGASGSSGGAGAGGTVGGGGTTLSSKQMKLFRNEIKNKSKAIKICQLLKEFVTATPCDDLTLLEVNTLCHYLTSTLMFTKELWKECHESSMAAMRGYQELLERRNPYDASGSREIYQLYLQNLEPLIRFCCYNLGITFQSPLQDDKTRTGSAGGARGFSNDSEMLTKFESIRLKTLSQETGGAGAGEVSAVVGDPIYDLFNSIVWCNHQISLPYHHSTGQGQGPALSAQDQATVTSLHSSCGKLISFLELQSSLLSSSASSASQLKSLYLPTPPLSSGSSVTSQTITHYLSLIQDIISIATRLLNSLPPSLLNSPSLGNRLSRDSLSYFRQYFTYLQYFAQYQHSVLILSQGKTQKGTGKGQGQAQGEGVQEGQRNEAKLSRSQEKVHICDQIMKNLKEMLKIVEGTVTTTLPVTTPSAAFAASEDCYEDILVLSLKSLESIYRTFRLVYLAETYGYYGLVLSALSSTTSAASAASGSADEKKDGEGGESEKDVLTVNLEKAYGLLEFADEVMTNDVYSFFENYVTSVSSTTTLSDASDSPSSSVSSVETCQAHLKALEDLISGGKTRLLAYFSLSTLPSSASSTASASGSGAESSSLPHTSMIRYPNQWISLTTAAAASSATGTSSKIQKLKNKSSKTPNQTTTKGSKKTKGSAAGGAAGAGESEEKTLILQPIPPLFEPIPCKPIFYDLASNYLDSTVNDVLDVRCGIKKPTKKKGGGSGGEGSSSASPSPSSAATVAGGGLVGAAASWIGWFSGGK